MAGVTLVEAMMAIAILGIVIGVGLKVGAYSAQTLAIARHQSTRMLTLRKYASYIDNSEGWERTVGLTPALKTHLTLGSTDPWVTTTPAALAVYDPDPGISAPRIAAAGTTLSENGAPGGNFWKLTATWKGLASNSVLVELTISRVDPSWTSSNDPFAGPRTLKLFKSSIGTKCVGKAITIRAGQSYGPPGSATNPVSGTYRWDRVTGTCDVNSGYVRVSLNVTPGCGAIAYRAVPDPNDDLAGSCFQLSAASPAQQAATGCDSSTAARDPNGTCNLLCCNFD
jgi:hypothetical protein